MESKGYWNNRYSNGGNSGYGSYGDQLAKKLEWLRGWEISSISEVGCGDFNFGSHLLEQYPNASYCGQDISEYIIEKNRNSFSHKFTTDITELPTADLLLCIDVLFHVLDDKDYENLLDYLERKWTKYLAITTYEYDQDLGNHVKIRKFDQKRFGKPIEKHIIEEDGQMYFYLFKKPSIDITKVTAVLNTKEKAFPEKVLRHVSSFPFGEILIKTHSTTPYAKYELFEKAKYDIIYYQDDDAICPIEELLTVADPDKINVAMKQHHYKSYAERRMTMGLGWGSFFPKSVLKALDKYREKYGEDDLFKRDTEKILTELVYPQNRFVFDIYDLPSATDSDRLWMQPEHWSNMEIIKERCKDLG